MAIRAKESCAVIDWMLEDDRPAVRYVTLTILLLTVRRGLEARGS
jgi:hypothetical protein